MRDIELTPDTDIFPNTGKENKPYFLSFIEEYWQGQLPNSVIARIEVNKAGEEYAVEEIRIGTYKLDEYQAWREKWDWKDVTEDELNQVREEAKKL